VSIDTPHAVLFNFEERDLFGCCEPGRYGSKATEFLLGECDFQYFQALCPRCCNNSTSITYVKLNMETFGRITCNDQNLICFQHVESVTSRIFEERAI
jgi:hypothetical protein